MSGLILYPLAQNSDMEFVCRVCVMFPNDTQHFDDTWISGKLRGGYLLVYINCCLFSKTGNELGRGGVTAEIDSSVERLSYERVEGWLSSSAAGSNI